MTRRELIAKVDAQTRRMNRWGIAWLAFLFVTAALGAILTDGSAETTSTAESVLAVAFFAVILGTALVMIPVSYRSMRRSGLVCPHCNRLLMGPLMQIAVASGNCGKCGEQIVTEES